MPALIADGLMRRRDARFADQARYKALPDPLYDKNQVLPLCYTEIMKRAIDSDQGRKLYGQRIAIVEPVFANLRHNKHLDRFTLRTQPKVKSSRWQASPAAYLGSGLCEQDAKRRITMQFTPTRTSAARG